MQIESPTASYGCRWLDLALAKLQALLQSAISAGTSYLLGGKISPLSMQADDPNWPGQVDCSGFVRWLLYHALGQPADFDVPDGSANQHQWMIDAGFKPSQWQDGLGSDGYIRVGVLAPEDTSEGIGHIWMTYDGNTIESHGGVGPSSRVLADTPILHAGHWFVLTPPPNAR